MKHQQGRISGKTHPVVAAALAAVFTVAAVPSQQILDAGSGAALAGPKSPGGIVIRPKKPKKPRVRPVNPKLNCRRIGPVGKCRPTPNGGKRPVAYACKIASGKIVRVVKPEFCKVK